jgi:subtilisin family serine protease
LNSDLQGILESLRNDERVRFAEPAYVSDDEDDVTGENVIHDPPDSGLWNHQAINLQTAWNTTKGAGVVVAVVDTLAKLDHPGLQEALFVIDDHLNFSGRNRIKDHGTHVMGIIGGRLSAPDVTLGVAPAARILAIAINTTMGSYPNRATALCFLADVANAKRLRIPESGIDLPVERLVVNCSWATTGDVFVIRDAIRRLVAAGALVCCSAGNDGRDAEGRHFPSDYDGVVCVAATDRVNRKLNVSNFGAKISFCAPGGDGDPLDEGDIFSLLAETSAGYLYGTSMASPHAAAVAALAWSLLPHRSATEIVEILRTTAKSIDSDQAIPTLQGQLGSGLIDAGAAVVRALEINPP